MNLIVMVVKETLSILGLERNVQHVELLSTRGKL